MLPTSKLLQEEPSGSQAEASPTRNPSGGLVTVPSIVVDDVDGNDDDPPPYTAIAPPNHVGAVGAVPNDPHVRLEFPSRGNQRSAHVNFDAFNALPPIQVRIPQICVRPHRTHIPRQHLREQGQRRKDTQIRCYSCGSSCHYLPHGFIDTGSICHGEKPLARSIVDILERGRPDFIKNIL
ncbi:uncharacterized protein LOC143188326 [Calliopsis andreniformis]|uniref:uncharacterized protein LOC143188326 n=1 Tax=Calliopsis andreniformis TaxID=337506 RepID=UPI003FCCCE09